MLKTKYLLLCASLLFTSTVFTACDDDDDSSSSTEKLLKSTTETSYEVNDGEIGTSDGSDVCTYTYGSKGRVIGLTEGDSYTCVISYNGNHVKTIKTSTENGKTTTKIDTSALLNEEGNIIRYTTEDETSEGVEFEDTVFNSYENGFLISEKRGNHIYTFTYENNCLKTRNNDGLVTYYYTDETTTTPIVSKGNWEGKFLSGKRSAYLPVKEVYDNDGYYSFKWTLNSDGYPVKREMRGYYNSKLSEYSVTTYTWQ